MPVNVVWHDTEKTILRVYFDQIWTWEDVYGVSTQTNQLVADESGIFHIIVEMSNVPNIPRGVSIRRLTETAKQKHPRTGITIFSGIHPAIKPTVNTILSTAFFGGFRFATDTEEAVRLIEAYKKRKYPTK